jgi:hypothetical protein
MELVVDPTVQPATADDEDERDAKQTVRLILWTLFFTFLFGFAVTGYYHYCRYAPDATLCLYTSDAQRTTADHALAPLTLVIIMGCVLLFDSVRRRRERLRKNI